jgi:hypothetical protein
MPIQHLYRAQHATITCQYSTFIVHSMQPLHANTAPLSCIACNQYNTFIVHSVAQVQSDRLMNIITRKFKLPQLFVWSFAQTRYLRKVFSPTPLSLSPAGCGCHTPGAGTDVSLSLHSTRISRCANRIKSYAHSQHRLCMCLHVPALCLPVPACACLCLPVRMSPQGPSPRQSYLVVQAT